MHWQRDVLSIVAVHPVGWNRKLTFNLIEPNSNVYSPDSVDSEGDYLTSMSTSSLPSPMHHPGRPLDPSSRKITNPEAGSPSAKGASLHVSPIAENWDIESDSGTLGQAATKAEAVELASSLAEEIGAEKVTVHASDGAVEREVSISLDPSMPEAN
jgi:hypothetical protein